MTSWRQVPLQDLSASQRQLLTSSPTAASLLPWVLSCFLEELSMVFFVAESAYSSRSCKNSMVRSQATRAAWASYSGRFSSKNQCVVPGYVKNETCLPEERRASSN